MEFETDLFGKLPVFHHGFRPGYQVNEAILATKLIIERSTEYGVPLCLSKLDIKKAFDRISHGVIADALAYFGFHPTISRAIMRELFEGTLTVCTPDGLSTPPIPQLRGVRQGGCSSPALFIFALAYLLRDLPAKWALEGKGWVLDDLRIPILAFADDLLLAACSPDHLQDMVQDLIGALAKGGLELSADKAEWSGNGLISNSAILLLHGTVVQRHAANEPWRYLGAHLTLDGSTLPDVAHHIVCSWKKFWSMRKWLMRRSIPLCKRLNLWQLALDSVCLWNSGTWTLSPEARQQLKSMELSQYMKIAMHPRRPEERGWDYRQRTARLFQAYLRKRGSGDLVYRAALDRKSVV